MSARPLTLGLLVLLEPLALAASETRAQASRIEVVGCGQGAALYAAEKNVRVWVTRQGTVVENNPLRPLSQAPLLVFQVVVNGRVATAWGDDAEHLRRGGPPAQVEAEAGHPIRWVASLDELPTALRVVAEDGAPVLGRLGFKECGVAPAATMPTARAKPGSKPARSPRPSRPEQAAEPLPPGMALPQGAIQ